MADGDREAPPLQRVSGIIEGQIVSLTSTPLLTSAATSWSGFLLEEVRSGLDRNHARWGWHRTHVCLVIEGQREINLNLRGRRERVLSRKGNVHVFPAGFGESDFEYDGSKYEMLIVEIEPERVTASRQPLPHVALRPQLGISDPAIARILSNMKDEVAAGCPNGTLYGQSLSLALATYVNGRFAVSPREAKGPGRISSSEARLLEEYVRAHLASDLSLTELADLLGMSSRTFSRVFPRSFGCTPHQYVFAQRMGLAKALLVGGKSIAEVAHATGFTPSHFTYVFKKTFGLSPREFRSGHMSSVRGYPLTRRS